MIPNVCCRYLVGAHIGWYLLRFQSRELRWWEEIIDPRQTSIGDISLGYVSVWDIRVMIDIK